MHLSQVLTQKSWPDEQNRNEGHKRNSAVSALLPGLLQAKYLSSSVPASQQQSGEDNSYFYSCWGLQGHGEGWWHLEILSAMKTNIAGPPTPYEGSLRSRQGLGHTSLSHMPSNPACIKSGSQKSTKKPCVFLDCYLTFPAGTINRWTGESCLWFCLPLVPHLLSRTQWAS